MRATMYDAFPPWPGVEMVKDCNPRGVREMGKVAIEISGELLRDFITDGSEFHGRVIDGLPEGAEFVRSFFDVWPGTAVLIYEHDSLLEEETGKQIPRLSPTLQSLQGAHEWTTLEPIEPGVYWVYAKDAYGYGPFVWIVELSKSNGRMYIDIPADGAEWDAQIEWGNITHWMGPLEEPALPEVMP